jgi:hypothetical protein
MDKNGGALDMAVETYSKDETFLKRPQADFWEVLYK